MKPIAFGDDIDDAPGAAQFSAALEELQRALPKGSQICSCVSSLGQNRTTVHLEIFIAGVANELRWTGKNLQEFSVYVQCHLIPMLWAWGTDYSSFFSMANFGSSSCLECRKEECFVFCSLQKKSRLKESG